MSSSLLSLSGLLLCGIGLLGAARGLLEVRALPRPELGPRGLARARGLEQPLAALLEPALRWLAALASRVPGAAVRARVEMLIEHAGHPLGLCADECLVLCGVAAAGAGAIAAALELAPAETSAVALAFAFAPLLQLHERGSRRKREIGRRLPAAIDLLALCMGAGLDFSGGLELVTRELGRSGDALGDELLRMLQELSMGRTRTRVLAEFAERVPTPAISDFVHAVILAEQRGNPLAEVLALQATSLRMKRSVMAEEAAARASVMMLLPLMLLLGAVVLLLFGPFIVNGVGL